MKTIWLRLLSTFVTLGLLGTTATAQVKQQEEGQPFKQIKLTDKQVQGFISAQKELASLSSKLEGEGDKPNPALENELEQIAKTNGFSTVDELEEVGANISMVLLGLDPHSGQFTEPPDQIKRDIDEVKQDTQIAQNEKDQLLSTMQEALKTAAPLQFKENVALVKKYQKQIDDVLPKEPPKQ